MDRIKGETVFITGAAQGIGLGMARAFLAEGAKVAIADIDQAALDAALGALSQIGEVAAWRLDVRDRDAFAQVADAVESRLGPVSILCNNAGVAGATSVHEMSYALWDLVIGVNLHGAINGVQTFVPRMLARGKPGHIVTTAAGSGLAVGGGVAGYMYQTSKYAVVGMTESLAKQLELAGSGIGATLLLPGPVPTNIIATTLAAMPAAPKKASAAEEAVMKERLAVMQAYLEQGVPPDEVGRMVVDAVRNNRLYLHTDRTMHDAIVARTAALLDAMPEGAAPSTAHLRSADSKPRP